MEKKPTVLYGVLNWGLGHATRSIPIIEHLIEQGFDVVICSDGHVLSFLQQRFPNLSYEELPAYKVKYSRGMLQLWGLALQLPRIVKAILREHRIAAELVRKYNAVGVISDNRLGFRNAAVPSVYITHQLKIIMPLNTLIASHLHHVFINRFTECWIPDFEEEGISGDIGHGLLPAIPHRFIGPCSRFEKSEIKGSTPEFNLVVILSGPEPQREILEEKLLAQLFRVEGQHLLIRGTKNPLKVGAADNIKVKDLVDGGEISKAIQSAEFVISRSGYSSLMDYYFLGNQALLIPTPGQPEQEYLARFQLHKGRFSYVGQDYINLEEDLKKASNYPGFGRTDKPNTNWGDLFSLFKGK